MFYDVWVARELLFHLWNRKHGTLAKKSIHLYRDDTGLYAEWAGDGEEGVKRFPDYDTAVVTIWQWTRDAGGEWRDLADHGRPSVDKPA